ncbi:MBL fold metallo-hydrolase [Pseudoalteromonas piscicida]|uniref:MBL fold metallo-hydrolase n=1 Tax=Pseudoalteromonas piscicida TaxID=43662 RepID=UPI0030956288
MNFKILHHGATTGVTGSCHELVIKNQHSVLIDCGLFQGSESEQPLPIEFDIENVCALVVTHCHIDHVGRIPYLLAAGFQHPIFCSLATAKLLPMVIEDALKLGVTREQRLIDNCLKLLEKLIVAVDFKQWFSLPCDSNAFPVKARLQRAGHILGSAYIEIELGKAKDRQRVVFSGDLGAPYTPLLPSPKAPYRADTLVIESTYGDKLHQGRAHRTKTLKKVIEKATADNGVVLIPAFSIGRTQELLYELEQIIHSAPNHKMWQNIEVIVDSPMAANFTEFYIDFKAMWDKEAKRKLRQGRHPLDFSSVYTIDSHSTHIATVDYLSKRNKPAIVIAASGMCSGGRIVNYLEQFLPDPTADVIFVGYQSQGTLGKAIQKYGPRGGYVEINDKRIDIKAVIHTISGYSAHADQDGLVRFVTQMKKKPKHIKLVHGDDNAKQSLKAKYESLLPNTIVEIAH